MENRQRVGAVHPLQELESSAKRGLRGAGTGCTYSRTAQRTYYNNDHLEPTQLYGCFHVCYPLGHISAASLTLTRLSHHIAQCHGSFPPHLSEFRPYNDVFCAKILFEIKLFWLMNVG